MSHGTIELGTARIHWVNAGRIPERQTKMYALAAWANDCERKLLGLHCGQVLDRKRHLNWAEGIV
jgi:hypothetical protein